MQYLSDAWFAAADEALRSAGPAPVELVIDQHVAGAESWRIVIGPECSIHRLTDLTDPLARPDAAFHQSIEVARAIARGDADAHQAILLGDVRFEGDIARVVDGRNGLEWLGDVLAPIMDRIVWN